MAQHLAGMGLQASQGPSSYYRHPYQAELLAWEVPPKQMLSRPAQLYRPLAEVPCTYVDTVPALQVSEHSTGLTMEALVSTVPDAAHVATRTPLSQAPMLPCRA